MICIFSFCLVLLTFLSFPLLSFLLLYCHSLSFHSYYFSVIPSPFILITFLSFPLLSFLLLYCHSLSFHSYYFSVIPSLPPSLHPFYTLSLPYYMSPLLCSLSFSAPPIFLLFSAPLTFLPHHSNALSLSSSISLLLSSHSSFLSPSLLYPH
jgi:hypothetical protein